MKAIQLSLKLRYAVIVDCLDSDPYNVNTVESVIRHQSLDCLSWNSLHNGSSN